MTDWAIPQQAKLKYTQLFNLHDRSRSGFLSGLQCRDILLQSGLPRNVLAEIWNLSDIDGDGQLTREEFILAMHLTNHVRSGQALPTELPADLVPPSYRRTRSVSATSVHSTTSAGSSITSGNNDDQVSQKSSENTVPCSVLNSNSFEDKRRENFEKGRAELERRRLKIIEQQSAVLLDQLAASKKHVAEAKAKIDLMRSDRDTKMGLITSLEAQLKTLQDRKAYLNHEELNLLAIAKDLNLVNPAQQAELDEIATQAKQQSINQMKEKLGEFLKEKEEKISELSVVTNRLEESKKQLKSLSETAIKNYENYKEKVANAKLLREQFVNENKSQIADLDSVWDSAPSFADNKQETKAFEPTPLSVNEDPWAIKSTHTSIQPNAFTTTSTDNEIQDLLSTSNFSSKLIEPTAADEVEVKSAEPFSQAKKYTALYAFSARNPDELTINPGDIIVGSDEVCEPGWLSGQLNGQTGLFPEAYVEPLVEKPKEAGRNNTPVGEATILASNEPVDFVRSNTSTNSAIKYRVVYAFEARNPDELTINPGDTISGIEGAHEPGWLMGDLNGQKGLFPEAYVERITEVAQEIAPNPPEVGKSRSKRAEVATVIANYRALGQEQLNLEKGQLVLIRRKMDSGWWEGEIQVKENKSTHDKHRNELAHLITELIRSERDFVDDLRLCQSAYILPLSCNFDVSDIFIKWNELIQAHESSLSKLSCFIEQNGGTSMSSECFNLVFEIFQNLLESLVDLYIEFCSQQRESVRRYEAKLASDVRFRQLVNECQRNSIRSIEQQDLNGDIINQRAVRNSKLPLTSFIVKPMQRITKYSLLFERILNSINSSGQHDLKPAVENLKASAQTLCNRVNDACRLKEEKEDNKRKLSWAQVHIKQSLPISDLMLNEQVGCIGPLSGKEVYSEEIIIFDSNTSCMGARQLIKSSSFIKWRSSKELIVFLFNDLLLLTQAKSSSPLRVEDVFQSSRAQQSYYKLYRAPILLEDVILRPSNHLEEAEQSSRSSWAENLSLIISFSDRSTGEEYNLISLNAQEKVHWMRELGERSLQAREFRAKHKVQLGLSWKRPSLSESFGRLFVTVLELKQNHLVRSASTSSSLSYDTQSLDSRKSSSKIASSARISVQMQMKRLKIGGDSDGSNKERMTPMSDIFKTASHTVNIEDYYTHSMGASGTISQTLIVFGEECTQYLLKNKCIGDGADFLEMNLIDESKFRETQLIGRRRVNLDELLSHENGQRSNDCLIDIINPPKMRLNRPVELEFKIRQVQQRLTDRAIFARRSCSPDMRNSMALSKDNHSANLSIKLRFHLQLFCDINAK